MSKFICLSVILLVGAVWAAPEYPHLDYHHHHHHPTLLAAPIAPIIKHVEPVVAAPIVKSLHQPLYSHGYGLGHYASHAHPIYPEPVVKIAAPVVKHVAPVVKAYAPATSYASVTTYQVHHPQPVVKAIVPAVQPVLKTIVPSYGDHYGYPGHGYGYGHNFHTYH